MRIKQLELIIGTDPTFSHVAVQEGQLSKTRREKSPALVPTLYLQLTGQMQYTLMFRPANCAILGVIGALKLALASKLQPQGANWRVMNFVIIFPVFHLFFATS